MDEYSGDRRNDDFEQAGGHNAEKEMGSSDYTGNEKSEAENVLQAGETAPECSPDHVDPADRTKPSLKKHKGFRVFIIGVSSVFAVALLGLAGIGLTEVLKSGGGLSNTGAQSTVAVKNPNGPQLLTSGTSTATSTSSSPTVQTNFQGIYNSLKDSMVSVEVYDVQSISPAAEGSGIIMSQDGYVITNEHVIDSANSVEVVLANKKQYAATIVGKDLRTDLAVLKINTNGLVPASFGNSDQLQVAESVFAIGNPGGLQFSNSVTEGIISALNRSVPGYIENCIQTDAAINPGNSGGALVNSSGQVIGITSSKITATGFEAMGFAIPINTAKPVIDDIIKYGYVTGRVKIGISVSTIDSYRASALGVPSGLFVQGVNSSSDAAAKGIQANDIITKINGKAVTSFDQFYQEESKYKAGNTIKLTIYRYSSKSTFDVSVKLLEDKGDTSSTSSQDSQNYGSGNTLPFSN